MQRQNGARRFVGRRAALMARNHVQLLLREVGCWVWTASFRLQSCRLCSLCDFAVLTAAKLELFVRNSAVFAGKYCPVVLLRFVRGAAAVVRLVCYYSSIEPTQSRTPATRARSEVKNALHRRIDPPLRRRHERSRSRRFHGDPDQKSQKAIDPQEQVAAQARPGAPAQEDGTPRHGRTGRRDVGAGRGVV